VSSDFIFARSASGRAAARNAREPQYDLALALICVRVLLGAHRRGDAASMSVNDAFEHARLRRITGGRLRVRTSGRIGTAWIDSRHNTFIQNLDHVRPGQLCAAGRDDVKGLRHRCDLTGR